MSPADLRREIEQRYGTIYRFIMASGLPYSSTYAALSGAYRGRSEAMLARIGAALDGNTPAAFDHDAIIAALQRVACAKCRVTDGRTCRKCRNTWEKQATAILELANNGGKTI